MIHFLVVLRQAVRVTRQVAVLLTAPKQFQQLAVLGGVGVNLPKLPSSTSASRSCTSCRIFLVIAAVGGTGISSVVSFRVWKMVLSPLK